MVTELYPLLDRLRFYPVETERALGDQGARHPAARVAAGLHLVTPDNPANPLVRELVALATQARLTIPLVEEVAADILMGTFTLKWRQAAAVAAEVTADTLYARYFDLPPATTWTRNRAVIEQSQILTTHNLASLVAGMRLSDRIGEHGADLGARTFAWIVKEQNTPYSS